MPITVAPASASARANWRWLAGKNGSTNTTFMPGMLRGGMFEALMANELVPETLWALTTSLLADMEFSIFFDDRAPVNAGPAAMMRP